MPPNLVNFVNCWRYSHTFTFTLPRQYLSFDLELTATSQDMQIKKYPVASGQSIALTVCDGIRDDFWMVAHRPSLSTIEFISSKAYFHLVFKYFIFIFKQNTTFSHLIHYLYTHMYIFSYFNIFKIMYGYVFFWRDDRTNKHTLSCTCTIDSCNSRLHLLDRSVRSTYYHERWTFFFLTIIIISIIYSSCWSRVQFNLVSALSCINLCVYYRRSSAFASGSIGIPNGNRLYLRSISIQSRQLRRLSGIPIKQSLVGDVRPTCPR